MILPAVGRHETRTGEKPMELITVSHSDSSWLGGRGANRAELGCRFCRHFGSCRGHSLQLYSEGSAPAEARVRLPLFV